MSVANEEAEDEDVVSRDDKETPIAGIASLTPDLGEALKQLLNRASEEGAPVEVLMKLKELVMVECRDSFRTELGADPPAQVEPLDVEFQDGQQVRPQGMRRYSPAHKNAMDTQVQALLATGLVRPGTGGAIVSPVLMRRKKDGTSWRMCVDHRAVNAITVPSPWPFPRLEAVLAQTEGAVCFGSADLVKGFWQIPLTERASKAFAFATHDGVFEPLRVPMGARNGATHFQKCMSRLFSKAGLLNRGVIIFIDDILLYARSPEELARLWARVLQVLMEAGLFIAPDKVELFKTQIVWCGHLLSASGVEADPARLQALNLVPEPENAAQLQQFLAAANWIRDKIPNYSVIVERL
jgi:hypothetical protein